jgi:hypothetical protein
MSSAEKYTFFERLMSDLEMTDEILSVSRFMEFSGMVRRHFRPEESGSICHKRKSPKVGPEVSAILSNLFQENASLTVAQVFEVLEREGIVPLPSKPYVLNWLHYRRREVELLSLLGGVNDSHEDISSLLSLFLTDEPVSGECNQPENAGSRESDAPPHAELPPVKKPKKFARDFMDSDSFNELLLRARRRKGDHGRKQRSRFDSQKFSAEHRELVKDVVETCQEDMDVSEQYEVFRRLVSDLELGEISSTLFHYSANSLLRKKKPDAALGQKRCLPNHEAEQRCAPPSLRTAEEEDPFWGEMLSVLKEDPSLINIESHGTAAGMIMLGESREQCKIETERFIESPLSAPKK